jgi:inner membrane protein
MDSITQIALGAAVGEAVLGRRVGNRAALWGGLCGLFPDLDLLVPLGDAVKNVTYHRSVSHSLFVLTMVTPLFVHLIYKIQRQRDGNRARWYLLVYLALVTHVLLDCFTVYGTQIFWPLPTPPVMWSTIFIIDPMYSLPLFGGVLAALVMTRRTHRGHLLNTAGLVLSSLYLAWTVGVKMTVTEHARRSLDRQHIPYTRVLTVPTPFNTLLWRVLAMDNSGYHEGFYSILDRTDTVAVTRYADRRHLLEGLESHWPVTRLQWFTHGFYAVDRQDGDIVLTDLRMGSEPAYVFRFVVGKVGNPHPVPAKSRRVKSLPRLDQLGLVWQRIWDENA